MLQFVYCPSSIQRMIPHKTKRGAAALARLKVYEVFPHFTTRSRGLLFLMLLRC